MNSVSIPEYESLHQCRILQLITAFFR